MIKQINPIVRFVALASALGLMLPAIAPASASLGRVYSIAGSANNGGRMFVEHHRVNGAITGPVHCGNGGSTSGPVGTSKSGAVLSGHKFSATQPVSFSFFQAPDYYQATGTSTFAGHFSSNWRHGAGTWSSHFTVTDTTTGAVAYSCSGSGTWKAQLRSGPGSGR